jgi:hypothetical protein
MENCEMPWNMEELEDDMHLILFNGYITFGHNNRIVIDGKEIYGKQLFLASDTLNKIGFPNKYLQIDSTKELYYRASENLWLLHSINDQSHEKIWREAEDFVKYFVKDKNRRFK